MSNPRYHNGHRRREVQAYYRARRADCYICGRPIDYGLRPPDPWSFVIDETVAIASGPTNDIVAGVCLAVDTDGVWVKIG